VANPEEKEPHKRYGLFQLLREKPRLVCAPDCGFLLSLGQAKKVMLCEIDRSTSGIRQTAFSKTPGFAELAIRQGHKSIFPETNVDTFSVLMIALTPGRRDGLRRAIKDKDGGSLWRFAAWEDLKGDWLTKKVWVTCEGNQFPLVTLPKSENGVRDGVRPPVHPGTDVRRDL
jgi:hypothetical protein